MKVTKNNLELAVTEKIISKEQADDLFNFLKGLPSTGASFDFTHVLYYMGGLIAIGAMTLFMNLGWESFGGWGIFFLSLAYAVIGLILAHSFQKKGHAIPAGICATFVISLAPLAIYGLQHAMGWWPDDTTYREYHRYIKWHWIYMEFGTLTAGAIIAYIFRYPFLQMPIAITLWYMSMDITAMLFGGTYNYELRALVSMYFGLLMILFAFWVDIRSIKSGDYAFWIYLFGVITFWGGMTSQHSDSELSKFIYLCVNLLLVGIGVIIVRRIFVIFGAIGSSIYLGHLANEVFKNSWFFPIALTIIGFALISAGLLWQKNEKNIISKVRSYLPSRLSEILAKRTA